MGKTHNNDKLTPMLRQYLEIKEQYNDTILFFRLGDFYEMFFDDAVLASKLLDITLTSRNKHDDNPIPLCGVPYHSVEPYIAKLLECGRKIAICEQVEDPKGARGVVKRAVTKIYTPGVVPEGSALNADAHTFVAAIYARNEHVGISYADVSTGLFRAAAIGSPEEIVEELARLEAREILVPDDWDENNPIIKRLALYMPSALITKSAANAFCPDAITSLAGASSVIDASPAAAAAAAAVLDYLTYTQRGEIPHISSIELVSSGTHMRLDESTKRNLEILYTMHDGEVRGSLIWLMNRTSTAMGARLLREWLLHPLRNVAAIDHRLDAVQSLHDDVRRAEGMARVVDGIADLERLTTRMTMATGNARDMRALATSFLQLACLKEHLRECDGLLGDIAERLDPHEDVMRNILDALVTEPPHSVREGGMIAEGVHAELDELRSIRRDGKELMARMEAQERERTRISTLKLRYNKVFGYYLEVTNTHRDKVPAHYIRKQTLSNAERYITPELKEYEEKVLGAEDRIKSLEYSLFDERRAKLAAYADSMRRTAAAVAELDVLLSFATIAREYRYVRPTVGDDECIDIAEGRHPTVECLQRDERFVPNDVKIGGDQAGAERLIIITGPNMAGKSTVMRQTALIVLMAQIGSFVPATSAHIGVVDRIFTRIGASDALAKGQSTFMVEMTEAATILREATPKSLIIVDEMGRGTSTFDGLAIAWSIAEEIHDRVRARTLFATHYHELTELAVTRPGAKNCQIAVKEWNDQVIFLQTLDPRRHVPQLRHTGGAARGAARGGHRTGA